MLSKLYYSLCKQISGAAVVLHLLNHAPATLDEVVQTAQIQNHDSARIELKQKTSLESFLSAKYVIGRYRFDFVGGSIKLQAETPYHELGGGMDYKLLYLTATYLNANKNIHMIFDLKRDLTPRYLVVLPEGESIATVIESKGKFNQKLFKEKISEFLLSRTEKNKSLN